MNKIKLVLSLVLVAGIIGIANAGKRGVPISQLGDTIQSADFTGVERGFTSFTTALSSLTVNEAGTISTNTVSTDFTVYGVIFSSGLCGDFVDVWDSTSATVSLQPAQRSDPDLRIYNVASGTTSVTGFQSGVGGICSGPSMYAYPVHFTTGLLFKPNSAEYNSINLLYRRDGSQ